MCDVTILNAEADHIFIIFISCFKVILSQYLQTAVRYN